MSKSKSAAKAKPEQLSVVSTVFQVNGRLFRRLDEARSYCDRNRLALSKVIPVPKPKVDLDVLRLSVRENWTFRSMFVGDAALLVFEHESKAVAFTVPLAALVDLAATVKLRVRELAQDGAL